MTPPTENSGAGSEKEQKAPETAVDQRPEAPIAVKIERNTHKETKDQQKDNSELLNAIDKITPEGLKKNLEQASEWAHKGDLDLLRSAGLSLDQLRQNPMDRHLRLASTFLKKENASGGALVFRLDYGQNQMAAWDLDLADILPANILTVDVLDTNNKIISQGATRGFVEGRPGYFDARTKERIVVQQGQKIRIRETQSSMAIKDKVYGEQTSLHAEREMAYLTENAQKTVIKEKVREEAKKQNKDVVTDKSFFDTFLSGILGKNINFNGLADPNNPLKIDFSKIQDVINGLLASFGFPKLTSSQSETAPSGGGGNSEKPRPTTRDQMGQGRESKESRNSPKINHEWLLQNVGRNDAEVQRFIIPVNFLGANMRVNRLIAPYLIEAEERARAAGIEYRAKQRDSYCQSWRVIKGGTSTLSMHSWGTAIDINTTENPWQPQLKNNSQNKGQVITNMPPELVAIMEDVGFRQIWWDPMHFELSANPYQNRGVLRSPKAQQAGSQYLA